MLWKYIVAYFVKQSFFVIFFYFSSLCFQEDLNKETLLKQFKIVKTHTNTSHVQQYGNKVVLSYFKSRRLEE